LNFLSNIGICRRGRRQVTRVAIAGSIFYFAFLVPGRSATVTLIESPSRLLFSYNNGVPPSTQKVDLTFQGGSQSWTAVTNRPWLSVSPPSGSGSTTLHVSVSTDGLPPTSYTGQITISAPSAKPSVEVVTVTLTVFGPNLSFNVKEVSAAIPVTGQASSEFYLSNTGGASLNWTARSLNSWLHVSQGSGTAPAQLTLTANLSGYAPGTYRGNVVVSAPGASGSPATLAFIALVSATTSSAPLLQLGSSSLNFKMASGAVTPASQSVLLSEASNAVHPSLITTSAASTTWSAQADQNWISLPVTSGSLPFQLPVNVNPSGMSSGTYTGHIKITAGELSGSPASIPVTFTVNPASAAILQANPSALSFTMTIGEATPNGQSIALSDSSGSPASWTAQADQSWIVLSSSAGSLPSQVSISMNPQGLSTGTYSGHVQITAAGLSGSPVSIPVSFAIASAIPSGTNFYVSPTGSSKADGSINDPWDLATALNQPVAVKPGATIWLRGGVYHGSFTSKLVGAPNQPIVVRQYPGERATIDSGTSGALGALIGYGSDTWFWGFEIMSSNPNRVFWQPGSLNPPDRADGVFASGVRNKYINLVVHDTSQGFAFWTPAVDSEIYGSLIFYNGWSAPDRGHGHGVYVQNKDGIKLIQDNIQFYGFGMGFHAYGSGNAFVQNIHEDGNVSFNSGYLAGGPSNHWSNYLVTGGAGASGIVFTNNHSYHNINDGTGTAQLGWEFSGTERDLLAENNYFVGGEEAVQVWNWNTLTFTGNTIYDKTSFLTIFNHTGGQTPKTYNYDHNTYFGSNLLRYDGINLPWSSWLNTTGVDSNSQHTSGPPTGVWTFVRPNQYEPNRANITVYNWDLNAYAEVDVSSILHVGQQYVVQDAMNFYGPPVASGVYSGSPIAIPMMGLVLQPPVGDNIPYQPVHTAPEFGVFVLLGN
jgi:hypothetical protein